MKTILDDIAENKRDEIQHLKRRYSLSDYENMEHFRRATNSLTKTLIANEFSIISEFKRSSPSAGIISQIKDPLLQVERYEEAGAAAISCLTDSKYFGGSMSDLRTIREHTNLPLLRKDFILDEIQLFEAKAYGADAILLIAELLDPEHAKQLTIIAQSLGMEVLMEAHDRLNLEKINELVDVIGINNRNLHLQKVSLQTSLDLRGLIPSNRLCISESGIRNYEDLQLVKQAGYKGALVGESLMKAASPELIISGTKTSA